MNIKFKSPDFNSPEPLNQQITSIIEQKILNKEIRVGQKLPPQEDLRAVFKVSINTMFEALSNLVHDGYISRRRNHGTVVISAEPRKEASLEKKNIICLVTCTGSIKETFGTLPYNDTINGIAGMAKEKKLNLLYTALSEDDEELCFNGTVKDIAGLVLTGNITPHHIKVARKTRFPFVLIGDVFRKTLIDGPVDVITSDDFEEYYIATKHLIDLGHRRIACLTLRTGMYPWSKDGLKGYKQALEDANVDFDNNLVIYCGMEMIYSTFNKYMVKVTDFPKKGTLPFTGLVGVIVPDSYFGVMKVFKEKSIRVPEDVSIIGPGEFSGMTVVVASREEMGRKAVERIIERLTSPGWKPQRIMIPNKLIIRESTRQLTQK